METTLPNGKSVDERIKEAISTIGEKLSVRRFAIRTKTDNDAFGAYLHMGGRIGVLTVVEGSTDEEAARDVAMHIAAINPANMFLLNKLAKKKSTTKEKF